MKLVLIRHAETVHNVGQAWAGTTDSALTNHGMIQIQRLAQHFVSCGVKFTQVFSSDLKRSRMTAEGICVEQSWQGSLLAPRLTPHLREQYFGSLEGRSWQSGRSGSQNNRYGVVDDNPPSVPSFIEQESEASMRARANAFVSESLLPILLTCSDNEMIAIVAHGIILRVLWGCLVDLFNSMNVRFGADVNGSTSKLGPSFLPFWSNTGFMELCIQPPPPESTVQSAVMTSSPQHDSLRIGLPTAMESVSVQTAAPSVSSSDVPLSGWTMIVLSVDNKAHLANLRRTGGGIGSAMYDTRQSRIDDFFSRSEAH